MTDKQPNDIEAQINAEIERELAADQARRREELAYRALRKLEMEHLDRVNARAPIEGPLAGLTPEQHAARLKEMDARARADMESMDRSNSRPIEGSLVHQRSRAALTPGSEGFEIRSGRRS
jgi:hypothetical protein